MGYLELIEKLRALPADKQAEVLDFIEFLSSRPYAESNALPKGTWTGAEFCAFSLEQALRGQEDDPVIYSLSDLKERWQ